MDNAIPHLLRDEDIKRAFTAMRTRLRDGGILLVSVRNYGPLIEQQASSTPPAFYRDGQYRRIVHQVWDWQEDRRYVVHLFSTTEKPDGTWRTQHFIGRYRAIAPNDLAALAADAGFAGICVLAPGETGYYQPMIRGVAPHASSSV
jgi:glycine/sarcosine N-methyltransferase